MLLENLFFKSLNHSQSTANRPVNHIGQLPGHISKNRTIKWIASVCCVVTFIKNRTIERMASVCYEVTFLKIEPSPVAMLIRRRMLMNIHDAAYRCDCYENIKLDEPIWNSNVIRIIVSKTVWKCIFLIIELFANCLITEKFLSDSTYF